MPLNGRPSGRPLQGSCTVYWGLARTSACLARNLKAVVRCTRSDVPTVFFQAPFREQMCMKSIPDPIPDNVQKPYILFGAPFGYRSTIQACTLPETDVDPNIAPFQKNSGL